MSSSDLEVDVFARLLWSDVGGSSNSKAFKAPRRYSDPVSLNREEYEWQ